MEYYRPATADEAVSLKTGDALYIAGGTDLGVMLADAQRSPDALIDLCGIKELSVITGGKSETIIGACTGIAEIASSGSLPDALTQGAAAIGSPQIRNMATIGGNICNASPCGDTLTPLLVLDAVFTVKGSAGERKVKAEEFFTGPKRTVLASDELLVKISLPALPKGSRTGFRMIGKRNGQAISQVNMAVIIIVENGKISGAKIAAGSVAPVPLRLKKCEALLKGTAIAELSKKNTETSGLLSEIARTAEEEVAPISDVRAGEDYRKNISGALLLDILEELTAGECD